MILTDGIMRERIARGELIRGKDDSPEEMARVLSNVGPSSIDVTLANDFKRPVLPPSRIIDLAQKPDYVQVPLNEDGKIVLPPNGFILGSTVEYLMLPNDIAADVDGRSTYARAGLMVQEAGMIAVGFHGVIVLEIKNIGEATLILEPGHRIAQIRFLVCAAPAESPYSGVYQKQTDTKPPIWHKQI